MKEYKSIEELKEAIKTGKISVPKGEVKTLESNELINGHLVKTTVEIKKIK